MPETYHFELVDKFEITPEEERDTLLNSWNFDTLGWLDLHEAARRFRNRWRIPQLTTFSSQKAFATARTLQDYVEIASRLGGNEDKHRAYKEICKFEIETYEDIDLLINSRSVRLQTIGLYLKDRKREKEKGQMH